MGLVNRKQVFAAKLPTLDINVEEWGGDVRLRTLTVEARLEMLDALRAHEAKVKAFAADQEFPEGERTGVDRVEEYDDVIFYLIHAIVDEKGALLFTLADYDRFKALAYPTLVRLYQGFLKLNSVLPTSDLKKAQTKRRTPVRSSSRARARPNGRRA